MSAVPKDPPGGPDKQIRSESDALRLLAFMGPGPVPVSLLAEHLPKDLAAALREAGDGLTEEAAAEVREGLDNPGAADWCGRALAALDAAFPEEPDDYQGWEECEQLLPHILVAVRHTEALGGDRTVAAGLLDRAAVYLYSKGESSRAMELSTQALVAAQAGSDNVLLGTLRHTQACLLYEHGDHKQAKKEFEAAIALHQALDPMDTRLRRDRIHFSELLSETKEFESARKQLDRATPARDPEEPERIDCTVRRVLGWLLSEQGDNEAAREEFEAAIELAERVLGPTHPDTGSARSGLGAVLGELGRYREAQEELEQALEITEEALGPEHPEVAVIRSNLSGVLQGLGKFAEARVQIEVALEAGEDHLPKDHRGLWIRHRKLAMTLQRLGNLESARAHMGAALEISDAGEDDQRIRGDLDLLAPILTDLNEFEQARKAYLRARAILEKEDASASELARYDLQLGRVCRRSGNLAESGKHLNRALAALEEDGQGILPIRLELAELLAQLGYEAAAVEESLGRGDRADPLRERFATAFAEALEGELPGADLKGMMLIADAATTRAPDLAVRTLTKAAGAIEGEEDGPKSRYRLATAWHRLGRHQRTQGSFEEAVAAFESALDLLHDSPQFQGVTLHDIADVRVKEGKLDEAVDLYRQAVARKEESEGDLDLNDLAATLQALGRVWASRSGHAEDAESAYDEALEVLRRLPEPNRKAEGAVLHDRASVSRAQGHLTEAIDLYREAAERKRSAGDALDPRDLGATLLLRGRTLAQAGAPQEALTSFGEWLEMLRELPRPDRAAEAVVLHDIANVREAQGELSDAIELYREAAEHKREWGNHRELAITLHALGRLLNRAGEYDAAVAAHEEELEALHLLPDSQLWAEGTAFHAMAEVRRLQGRLEDAIELYREAVERRREAKTEDGLHSLIAAQQGLGRSLELAGDYEEALQAYEEQLKTVRSLSDASPLLEGVVLHDIADVRVARDEGAAAIGLYEAALEHKGKSEEEAALSSFATTLQSLGRVFEKEGDLEPAQRRYREALERFEALSGRDYSAEGLVLRDLADVSRATGDSRMAIETYREAVERCRRGGDPHNFMAALSALGMALKESGDWDAAVEAQVESLEVLRSLDDAEARAEAATLHDLGDLRQLQGRFSEAIDLFRDAAERRRSDPNAGPGEVADSLIAEAECEVAMGRPGAALQLGEEAIRLLEEADLAKEALAAALTVCGEAAEDEEEPEKALQFFVRAAEALKEGPAVDPIAVGVVGTRKAGCLDRLGREQEAAAERAAVRELLEERLAAPPSDDVNEFAELCAVSIDNGDIEIAASAIQRLGEAVGEDPFDPANLMISQVSRYLGTAYESQLEDFDAAYRAYEESLERLRALPQPDPHAEGVILHNIADSRRRKGDTEEAVARYREAVERKRLGAEPETIGDFSVSLSLLSLASTLYDAGETGESGEAAGEALALLRTEGKPPSHLVVTALSLLAADAKQEGELDRALELLEEAKGLLGESFKAYRLSPERFYSLLAEVYGGLGRTQEQADAMEQAETLAAND